MPILRRYNSPRGAWVIPVHWSADESKKNDPTWEIKTRAQLATEREWAREYDIDFGSEYGQLAYSTFSSVNIARGLEINPELPICLACDFNVSPMAWVVLQIQNGRPRAIDEICIPDNATVEEACREFRNRYHNHRPEVRIYGDASGNARGQTGKSSYQLMDLAFGGANFPRAWFVPKQNGSVKDRVATVCRSLKGQDGVPSLLIDEKCKELLEDMTSVVWRSDGRDLLKIWDPEDPYSKRTHFSDALGYFLTREFSIGAEVANRVTMKKRPPQRVVQGLAELAR